MDFYSGAFCHPYLHQAKFWMDLLLLDSYTAKSGNGTGADDAALRQSKPVHPAPLFPLWFEHRHGQCSWFSALTRVNLKLSPILKLRFNYVIVSIGANEVHQQNQSRHGEVEAFLLFLGDSTQTASQHGTRPTGETRSGI